MKKVLLLVLSLSLVLGIATVLWAVGDPGVHNTPHDVGVMTGGVGLEPCAMCHTPHSGTGDYPLWNRDQAEQTYELYSSPTFDMAPANPPQSPSSLCLICHNGVFSELVNYPGPGSHANEDYDYEMNSTFWAMLGTSLKDEHPISFTYDPAKDTLGDNNGFPAITPTPRNHILGSTTTQYWLYGTAKTQFECATCHAVHNTGTYTGGYEPVLTGGKSVGPQVFFLRHSNEESKLCADCHVNRY